MISNHKPLVNEEAAGAPARTPRFCRADLLCGFVVLVTWLAVSLPRLHGPIDLRWDASSYFVLGTSLAQGKGYRLLNEPGEIRAVQYPPLLPLIVAAHERVLRSNDYFKVGSALRVFYFILSGFYLIAAYALARKLLSPLLALTVAISIGLSFYSFLHISDTLYAELPFAVVTTLFLIFHRRDSTALSTALDGLFGAAAYLLRTAGLALLAAWIAESLLRRRLREAALRAVIAAVPILLWQTYIWHVTHSDEYRHPVYSYQRAPYYYSNVTYGQNSRLVSPFRPERGETRIRQLPIRIMRNLTAIPLSLGESSLVDRHFGVPGRYWHKTSRILICWLVVVGAAALVGAFFVARGPAWFLSLYFALMLGLVVLTPWPDQFWRYLAPLTPLTLIFVLFAAGLGVRFLKTRNSRWGQAGMSMVVLAITGTLLIQVAVSVYFLRTLLPISYYEASGREQAMRILTYTKQWHSLDSAFDFPAHWDPKLRIPRGQVVAAASIVSPKY